MRRRARGGAGDRPARRGEEHEGNIVDIVSMLMHEIKYMLFQLYDGVSTQERGHAV